MLRNSGIAQKLSRILGKICGNIPLHPTVITISSILFAFSAYFLLDYNSWISFGLFLFAFFADALDGAVARAKNLESRKGAFIDGIADRIVEFFIILSLFKLSMPFLLIPNVIWLFIILFFGTGMTSFVKAYSDHTKTLRHEKAIKMSGMLERAERSILLLFAFLLVLFGSDFSIVIVMFTAVLSFFTFLERFMFVIKHN